MSKAVEAKRGIGSFGDASSSSSSSSSASTPSAVAAAKTQSPISGSTRRSISSTATSPHKKASPSDVIFGKPPGRDSASKVYESLNADSSSSTSGRSSVDSGISKQTIMGEMNGSENTSKEETGRSSASGSGSDSGSDSDVQRQAVDSIPASSTSNASQTTVEAGTMDEDIKILPYLFEDADSDDIVVLVADMLTRLTTHNDLLPLHPTSLTRFHSRATPSISILSYLKRITKYTSLEKSCTLILLVYIDRVCQRISGFTICSLTVHRFICAAVVCASKALCDSFSTNGHYARVGGISLIELNMLEKEFLNIINWKLSCSGALLQHYYTSLVKSHQSFQLDPQSLQQQESEHQHLQNQLNQPEQEFQSLQNNGLSQPTLFTSDDVDMDTEGKESLSTHH